MEPSKQHSVDWALSLNPDKIAQERFFRRTVSFYRHCWNGKENKRDKVQSCANEGASINQAASPVKSIAFYCYAWKKRARARCRWFDCCNRSTTSTWFPGLAFQKHGALSGTRTVALISSRWDFLQSSDARTSNTRLHVFALLYLRVDIFVRCL